MKFHNLIKNNHWESVKLILLELYPDQLNGISGYEKVFKSLPKMKVEESNMEIILTFVEEKGKEIHSYIDVSGREMSDIQQGITDKYFAIEFVPWSRWLGMEINEKTAEDYTELEIIAHCLWEMTFIGYNEKIIQSFLSSTEGKIQDYKKRNKKKPSK